MAGHVGLELADVIFGKPLKYRPNSLWFQRTLWGPETFRPRAAINIVEMTSAGSSPLSPGSQPRNHRGPGRIKPVRVQV
jgi:hypothetical protein